MERESMVFYKSFLDAIRELPPEEFKRCACALLEYGIEGKEPTASGIEKTVYLMAKPQIDKNNQRYENGKRGGRPLNQTETETKPNENQTETKEEPKANPPEPNVNVNVNDNVNVNNITHPLTAGAPAHEGMSVSEFLAKYPNIEADTHIAAYGLDFDLLDRKFQESKKYLQGKPHTLSWLKREYPTILKDKYKDRERAKPPDDGMGYNGTAFFDRITENLKAREAAKENDG